MGDTAATCLGVVLLALNTVSFALYGIDKLRAKQGRRRIPERKLLAWAVAGVVGALAGMLVFHHKIRKPRFAIGVPAILAAELALVVGIATLLGLFG